MVKNGDLKDAGIAMNVVPATNNPNTAVIVQDAYKRYSADSIIFNGLNLSIRESTIYGLLGPSGCGKTTLLNCILGKSSLDAGCIKLNVDRRSDIGFMPQKVCLYDRLKISENISIFGYLFGLTTKEIMTRLEELLSFLEIPDGDRFVGSLSGGEQRRVSLAVTFLHDPKILFLDEPTVGLDSVLSESIWNRLLQMAETGKTIIITTHYIQEATRAHKIGLMRNGVLLAEDAPEVLLERFGTDNLEDVFIQLIETQERSITRENKTHYHQENKDTIIVPRFKEDRKLFSIKKLKATNYKNWVMLKREYVFLAGLLILPILQLCFTVMAIGRKPDNIPIAVINEEISIAECNDYKYNRTGCFLENQSVYLSCLFLDILKSKSYTVMEYNDNATAITDLKFSKVDAILQFGKNYSSSYVQILERGFIADPASVNNSFVDVYIDPQDVFTLLFVKADAYQTIRETLASAMSACGLNPNIASLSSTFKLEKPIFGNENSSYGYTVAISYFCLLAYFIPMALYGGFIFIEIFTGVPYRLSVAGVSILVQTISIVTFVLIIHLVQALEGFVIIFWFLKFPMLGSIMTLTWLIAVLGLSGIFFGLFICSVSNKMTIVAFTACGFNICSAFTCGASWPLEGAHYMLRRIQWMIPLTYESQAARSIALKGFSFWHSHVLKGFISCWVWSLIFIVLSSILIRRQKGVWSNYQ